MVWLQIVPWEEQEEEEEEEDERRQAAADFFPRQQNLTSATASPRRRVVYGRPSIWSLLLYSGILGTKRSDEKVE